MSTEWFECVIDEAGGCCDVLREIEFGIVDSGDPHVV